MVDIKKNDKETIEIIEAQQREIDEVLILN